jgi:Protein of unknown function (DUF2946)
MHWHRTRLRLGSYIALFALAVQLVLTFGHVHLNGVGGYSSIRIEAAAGPVAPAGHEGPKAADDYCAACALIHLAGTLMPTAVAALPLPLVFGQLRRPHVALRFALPASPPASFAARAPPFA